MQKRNRLLAVTASWVVAVAFGGVAVAGEVTYDRLLNAQDEEENWLMVHKTYNSNRFVTLDQINSDNVGGLKLVYALALGGTQSSWLAGGAHQHTPLVDGGEMYLANGWGETFKIDLSSGTRAVTQWIMDPGVDPSEADIVANRGLALLGNNVYTATLDGRLMATDREFGEVVWERQLGSEPGEAFTGAPLAVKDMILIGQSLGDWGTRGWLEAVNAETGESIWRTYTVPEPGQPGSETWLDDHGAWRTGGASLWVTGSYDPELNLTFWGTGNPVPMFDPEFRPGDNLYSDSVVAFDVDSGEMAWYFQYTPGDYLDYDEVGIHLIYDVDIDGETRKVLGHFGRNGFYYGLDRATGAFLHGSQYVKELTWTEGLDSKTGMPLGYDPNAPLQEYIAGGAPRRGQPDIEACPHLQGGVNFFPTAYNPMTGMAYGAGIEGCFGVGASGDQIEDPASVVPGEIFLGGAWANPVPQYGSLNAVDIATGELAGQVLLEVPNHAGLVTTAGNLVFLGQLDGDFLAFDATTLEQLWSINVGAGFKAPPMSFAVDGKQYIAIMAGNGGVGGLGLNNSEFELIQQSSMLFVFSL